MSADVSDEFSLSEAQASVLQGVLENLVVLVRGAAGTGKTTTALWVAHEVLAQRGTPWQRVLFLTFSRTAVGQVRDRFNRASLQGQGLADRIDVATFHGFAYQMIQAFGIEGTTAGQSPRLRSAAEVKLLGEAAGELTYQDLLPEALKILRRPGLRSRLQRRWSLVVCDEFQDTGADEWELLNEVGDWSRLLLMADPNQTIFDSLPGKTGAGLPRIQAVEAGAHVIDLPTGSFRDPTNVVPSCAERIRRREFDHPAVAHAVAEGRLRVEQYDGDSEALGDSVVREIRRVARTRCSTVGVFMHGNAPVAALSAELLDRNISHVLVGLPEAHGEALAAMASLLALSVNAVDDSYVGERLGAFAAASRRGSDVPRIASILAGHEPSPSAALSERLQLLNARLLNHEGSLERAISAVCAYWTDLGVALGRSEWRRAIGPFRSAVRTAVGNRSHWVADVPELLTRVSDDRVHGLVASDDAASAPIRLMNLHQTKGREADATILAFTEGDYFGRERDPFERGSRLMYVAFTRARDSVIVLLPPNPHPLAAPLQRWVGAEP